VDALQYEVLWTFSCQIEIDRIQSTDSIMSALVGVKLASGPQMVARVVFGCNQGYEFLDCGEGGNS